MPGCTGLKSHIRAKTTSYYNETGFDFSNNTPFLQTPNRLKLLILRVIQGVANRCARSLAPSIGRGMTVA
jgi:hypothetical protein